jgi:hypothetical protein
MPNLFKPSSILRLILIPRRFKSHIRAPSL